MASLAEVLQKTPQPKKPDQTGTGQSTWLAGQLVKSSKQGIQNLAQQAGSQTPTTALGAALLGASPQQQAMAGTQANVQSTIKKQLAPPTQINQQNTYANQQATQAPSNQQTAQQQTQTGQAQELQTLTGVQARVQDLINSKITNLATTQVANPAALSSQSADLQQKLVQLEANPTDPNLLAQVNTSLGRDPATPLSPDEINALYQSSNQAIVAGATQHLPHAVTVSDLSTDPNFGYTTDQLSQILGIPADQVGSMSLPQLQSAITALNTSQAQNAQTQMSSLEQGGAAQQAYLNQSKQLDTSGVSSTENQLGKIAQAVQSGQTIQFNGQQVDLNTLLGDSGITKTISDYLNSPVSSDIRNQIDKNEPGLSQFINSNVTALQALQKTLDTNVTTFNKSQADTLAASTVGNTQLSDSVMKAIDPTWGQFNSTAGNSKLLSDLKTLAPKDAESAAAALNSIAQSNPDLLAHINELTADELKGIADPTQFQKLSQSNTQAQQIQSALASNDIDQALSLVVGQTVTKQQIQDQLKQDQLRAAFGFQTSGLEKKISLDDLNSAHDILNNANLLGDNMNIPNIHQVASGTEKLYSGNLPAEQGLSVDQQKIVDKLGQFVTASGLKVDPAQLLKSGVTADDLKALQDSGYLSALKSVTGGSVDTIQKQALNPATEKLLAGYAPVSGTQPVNTNEQLRPQIDKLNNHLSMLQDWMNVGDFHLYSKASIQAQIDADKQQLASMPSAISESEAKSKLSEINTYVDTLQKLAATPDVSSMYNLDSINARIKQLQSQAAIYWHALNNKSTPNVTITDPTQIGPVSKPRVGQLNINPTISNGKSIGSVLPTTSNARPTLGSLINPGVK